MLDLYANESAFYSILPFILVQKAKNKLKKLTLCKMFYCPSKI